MNIHKRYLSRVNTDTKVSTTILTKGMRAVITGSFPKYTRFQFASTLIKNGIYVHSRVTRNTDILIVGAKPGSTKLELATKYNIKLLTVSDIELLLSELDVK